MSVTLLKKYLPISLALLLFYGSASRFTHGATSTASFYQYQNDRSPDDGSTLSNIIPVFDFLIGSAILRRGFSGKLAICFVASTIGSVAVQRYMAGLDCQGDFLQAIWAIATAVVVFVHTRQHLAATANGDDDIPKLAVKQYIPHSNPNPQPGDVTIVGAHANGFPKELYEPLWDELFERAKQKNIRIRSIWIADVWNQSQSGGTNENLLGNDSSWYDHARDLMYLINQNQRDMPHPIVGVGHSMGGSQLAQLALWHPRLLNSLVLIDPILQIPNPSISLTGLSTKRRDIWPSRDHAAARFKQSKFFQAWDPRVLDLWIEYGLRKVPTELYPAEKDSLSDERVTLTTSKHQELFGFVRPTYLSREWERSNDQDPEQNLDCPNYPFHRPEPPRIFRQLPELQPSLLYIFGKQSDFSSPSQRQEKMQITGTGVGGNGGSASGRVQEEVLDCGHLVPMEKVTECADAIASFLDKEMSRWRAEQDAFKKYREGMSRRQQITIDEEWEDKVKLGEKYPKNV
ncbi:related to host-specific AK-toxin Akt2 [Fusarium torulosum]|uniref:Related to host-specific AK-toxin Akt2 n=1 Tax=Fusarium torulosum TaxID=33205 RepID=A0AAE8M2G8_9HYPO|nr:related to host-specific AK-toxin Akt2 [Fusarium torulosum]